MIKTVPICTFTLQNNHELEFKGGFIRLSDFRGAANQASNNPTKQSKIQFVDGSIAYQQVIFSQYQESLLLIGFRKPHKDIRSNPKLREKLQRLWVFKLRRQY